MERRPSARVCNLQGKETLENVMRHCGTTATTITNNEVPRIHPACSVKILAVFPWLGAFSFWSHCRVNYYAREFRLRVLVISFLHVCEGCCGI